MKRIFALGLLALAAAAPASAQTFGSVNLRAGFTPDPWRTNITSGGTIQASNLFSNCRGWVADAVDFAVYYQAGSFNLTISANSNADTTLIVRAPDGQFYCDDDSGPGLNPAITINRPQSGAYSVWVGSYRQGEYAQATLSISELGIQ
ncbi:peptidase S1 [Maricaulis parjimensis]|uniref:peptidase S1 n=1 Tax=Maricaulis parjimensis TaxID=144023 RepID=UPI001939BADD|nr:peptidase S1 [Maricaulis parjimensis]